MNDNKDTGIDIGTKMAEDMLGHTKDNVNADGQIRPGEQNTDAVTSSKDCDTENKEQSVFKFESFGFCGGSNEEKTEVSTNSRSSTLEEDLYDGDIAEIYLGEAVRSIDNAKHSGGSDSNLSEMTSSFGPVEDTEADSKTRGDSQQNEQDITNNGNITAFSGIEDIKKNRDQLNKQFDASNSIDTKKRPLSPSFTEDENFESKRIKTEPLLYSNHGICKSGNSENGPNTLMCPLIAVVAPLEHCEDTLIDDISQQKNQKEEPDVIEILDSLEQDDDKHSFLFDAVFEKMKTDIINGNSFKTMDGNNWTFDKKSSNDVDNNFKSFNLSEFTEDKHMFKTEKENFVKPELKRSNSVEHDIEDFEKVLNSVIAKANRIPKPNENVGQLCGGLIPTSGVQKFAQNKHCQQPCNHVANSDLLRELLDQKTESNDKQTIARQEIDLSFLHSDLVSGKGLSVSSDKILQTRTIDPRLTSFPHVEKHQGTNQTKLLTDASRANKPSATQLLEDDYVALAEQRRASVTLHHKVPPQNSLQSPQGNTSSENNSACGGSNIIKEAFDFAFEMAGCANDENDSSVLPQPDRSIQNESTQQGFINGSFYSSQKNENHLNRNSFENSLKVDLVPNHQVLRNQNMQDIHPGNGLLTFANPSGVRSPDTNLPPQLAGPFMNANGNSVSGHQDFLKQTHINQRSAAMFPKNAENMSANSNRIVPANGEMQQFTTQNPNAVHAHSVKHLPTGQMDSLHSSGLTNRHNQSYMPQNSSTGYPTSNAAYSGHMSRNGMSDFRPGSEENMPNFRYDSGHPMSRMNLSMGMQERIRAMNVQQWYRRRMQVQMNRPVHPHGQQMMRHPMMQGQAAGSHAISQGQGLGSHPMAHAQGVGSYPMTQNQGIGSYQMAQGQGMGLQQNAMGTGQRIKPGQIQQDLGAASHPMLQGQDIDPRLRAMQTQTRHINNPNASGNHKMHHNTFSQGQGQINLSLENQNQRHMQYGQQMNQLRRTPDAEVSNSMQMSKSFSADMFLDNTHSMTAQRGNLNQQDRFSPQSAQDFFPFDV